MIWMKKRLLAFTLGLCLLAGCGERAGLEPAPTATQEVTATPEPTKEGVFFDTLPITEMEEFSSYEIEEQGKVFCVTTGQSVITGSQGLPNQYRVTVPGGAWDELETDMSDALFCYREDFDD